jgi:small-conductance mechanosensitive channel
MGGERRIVAVETSWTIGPLLSRAIISLLFLLLVVGVRLLLVRWISQQGKMPSDQRRRWLINSRNALIFILVSGLVLIWANELRTLAVSLLAIAVAFVIATKELILCFSGALLRRATDAYGLGDRIEIAGMRGEVIDITYFGATLREIGPGRGGQQYTGRSVTVPHSLLLNNPVINETFTGAFQIHLFSVPWVMDEGWQRAEQLLLEAAREASVPVLDQARGHMKKLEDRRGIEPPSLEPRVSVEIPEPGRINFQVRVPVSSDRLSRTEQSILHKFLISYYADQSVTPEQKEP